MKITKTIEIEKPVDQVWDLIANQFDKAHLWMGPIPRSVAVGKGLSQVGAPMQGRICDLSKKPNGPKVREVITHFDEAEKSLTFDVLPIDNPGIVPIKQNKVQMSIRSVAKGKTKVVWTASPQLKPFAFVFYPLLRLIFPVAFGKLLQGLKDYAEKNMIQRDYSNT